MRGLRPRGVRSAQPRTFEGGVRRHGEEGGATDAARGEEVVEKTGQDDAAVPEVRRPHRQRRRLQPHDLPELPGAARRGSHPFCRRGDAVTRGRFFRLQFAIGSDAVDSTRVSSIARREWPHAIDAVASTRVRRRPTGAGSAASSSRSARGPRSRTTPRAGAAARRARPAPLSRLQNSSARSLRIPRALLCCEPSGQVVRARCAPTTRKQGRRRSPRSTDKLQRRQELVLALETYFAQGDWQSRQRLTSRVSQSRSPPKSMGSRIVHI